MGMQRKKLTLESLDKIGKSAVGKSFREICGENFPGIETKGGLGLLVEQYLFHIQQNNLSEPDFQEIGVELKVTPVIKNKNKTYSAKERLVLGMIDYKTEPFAFFESSHFWHKNSKLYIMFYEHIKNISKYDFVIKYAMLFDYPEKDLEIIKKDWEYIMDKIKQGKAHEISEADTMYLGACTKGESSKSLTTQPFSDTLAMQRAYCLKQSYMTQLVRQYIQSVKTEEITSAEEIKNQSLEQIVENKLLAYKGVSGNLLFEKFNISLKSKSKYERLVAKILGINGKISETEEFVKANIILKTIRVKYSGRIKESMSFPSFKFCEIIKEDWESSQLRKMFCSTKYLFVVFRETTKDSDDYVFDKVVLWNMPLSILDSEVKSVWEKTKCLISEGKILTGKKTKNGKRKNFFPKSSENEYCHVRPHAKNSLSTYPLPVKDIVTGIAVFTKQCFWLNDRYVKSIILK